MHVPLDKLLFLDPVPAGMNLLVIASLAYGYRSSNEDVEPISIRHVSPDLFRVMDGRHRCVASVLAGRKTVLAVVE